MTNRINDPARIKGIEAIDLVDRGGRTVEIPIPAGRVADLSALSESHDLELGELITEALYGIGKSPLAARFVGVKIRFAASRALLLSHDLSDGSTRLEMDGRPLPFQGSAGESLFGLDRPSFQRTFIHDFQKDRIGAGPEELGRVLRSDLEGPNVEAPGTPAVDLESLRRRRKEIEGQLEALGPATSSGAMLPVVDPPALAGLLEALEDTRVAELRMLERRLEMSRRLDGLKNDARGTAIPSDALIQELEALAGELEQCEAQLHAIESRSHRGQSRLADTFAVVLLLTAAAMSGFGQVAAERDLLRLGFALGGSAVLVLVVVWVRRFFRLIRTADTLRETRARRLRARERARVAASRIGTPTSTSEFTAESLRKLVDSTQVRREGRRLDEAVAPFVDSPNELTTTKTLVSILGRPLEESARDIDRAPAVPLVRATRAVLSLASDWQQALRETTRRVKEHVTNEVRNEIERDLLLRGLEKIEAAEKAARRQPIPGPDPRPQARRELARRIRRSALPELARILGPRAPHAVTDELRFEWRESPSAATNAVCLGLIRLVGEVQGEGRLAIGRLLVEPRITGTEAEAFLRWLLDSPTAGVVLLTGRQTGLARSLRAIDPFGRIALGLDDEAEASGVGAARTGRDLAALRGPNRNPAAGREGLAPLTRSL